MVAGVAGKILLVVDVGMAPVVVVVSKGLYQKSVSSARHYHIW